MLTTVHYSREKSDEFPFHTLGSCEKLQVAACLAKYFQIKEKGVKKLKTYLFKRLVGCKKSYFPDYCGVQQQK